MGDCPPVLLDVSRLVSRVGRGRPTGIDRVEAAWLGHLARDPRHYLLCNTRFGQLVLGGDQAHSILRWLGISPDGLGEGGQAQPPLVKPWVRLAARVTGQRPEGLAAQAVLARSALAHARRDGRNIARKLAKAGVGTDAVYLNLGHSNLGDDLLGNMPLRRAVLIHDAIPLDYPAWARPSQIPVFRNRLTAAFRHADLLVTVSHATAARLAYWRDILAPGIKPSPLLPAHIGTTLTPADPAQELPRAPYFVILGTIEPRKNHAFLLDVWARMSRPPRLVIIGNRGWLNSDVFARLDGLPPESPVLEMSGLSDAAVAAIMQSAHGLLFPSLAEGFGLPLTEAAARGIPVLAMNLPATHEILGDYVQYLGDNPKDWADRIELLAKQVPIRYTPVSVPDWDAHFRKVSDAITDLTRQ